MKKYQIIYADPPWEYDSGRCLTPESLLSGNNQTPYHYMSVEQICMLPIYKITDDDCLLFLWTTGPKLNIAPKVITSWGFEYSTVAFVWEKEETNPGYYTLSSTEFCLVGKKKKGKIPQPRGARNIRQFLSEKRRKHSQKPDTIRERIDLMFPTQSKIELFARKKIPGWDVWGKEVESDIELQRGE